MTAAAAPSAAKSQVDETDGAAGLAFAPENPLPVSVALVPLEPAPDPK